MLSKLSTVNGEVDVALVVRLGPAVLLSKLQHGDEASSSIAKKYYAAY